MEEIACILCGEFNENVAIEENGFLGRKCFNCELIYISPRPSFSEILDLYGHDDAHISASAHISSSPAKQLHAKHTFKHLRRHLSSGKVLEIGAGSGYFLEYLGNRGLKPYGIEFNPIQAAYIRDHRGIPCAELAVSEFPFGRNQFDVIYHCDVTSHFHDPVGDFLSMYESLLPGGLMILETGNLGETDPKFFKHVSSFMYPDHLFFFGEKSLKKLLEKTGFSVTYISRYSLTPTYVFFTSMSKLKQRVSSVLNRKSKSVHKQNIAPSGSINEQAKNRSQNIWMTVRHYLRYTVGGFVPKKGRPQTQIIVAVKR